ncbi:MAG: flagellar filament capping protein FliD [Sphingomonadales bacterium]|nr:flagellar filament capping protein FliD [Sphingomonadales bacterium]
MATSVSSTTSTTATTPVTAPDSASIGSALATALGGGTGIDMTQLAGNLASAEFMGRLGTLDSKSSKLDTTISQASQLKSDLLALSTSLGSLVRGGSLTSTPSVANTTVATASLPTGSSGASGSYSLEVTQLASPQVLNSPAYTAGTATTGSGTLTLNFGTISGGAFTADASHAAVNVTIAAGATLNDVATAINQAGAGVNAYVATGADGAHLVLKGQQGAANAFTLSATEAPGDPGLASLAWDPSTGPASRVAASANDAQFKLDGISRTASSNTVANAAPGLSLVLTGTNSGAPTTISYSDPTSGIGSAMQDLTTALNSLVSEINTDTDATAGGLGQDPATRSIRRQLSLLTSTTIMPNAGGSDPKTLSDLGLSVSKDGTFSLDTTKLTGVLSKNPSGVAAMFTTGLYGVFGTVDSMTRTMTSGTDPSGLGSAVTKYTKMKTTLADQRTALVAQQDKLRTRLINQFAKANANVAASKSTLTQLQGQIAAWNKTN